MRRELGNSIIGSLFETARVASNFLSEDRRLMPGMDRVIFITGAGIEAACLFAGAEYAVKLIQARVPGWNIASEMGLCLVAGTLWYKAVDHFASRVVAHELRRIDPDYRG